MPQKVIFCSESKLENECIYVSEKDFQSPHLSDKSAKLAIKEINKMQNFLYNNIKITEVFSYKGNSLWWFFYPQIFFALEKTLDFIENFSEFIEKEKPSSIYVLNDFGRIELIKQICKKKQIDLSYSKVEYYKEKISKRIKNSLRHFALSLLTKQKIKKRKNLFTKKKTFQIDNSILFLAGPHFRRGIFNPQKNITERGEYFIQNLIDLIKDDYNIMCIDIFTEIRSNETILSERLNSDLSWVPLEVFFKKLELGEKQKFLEKYEQIISSKKFQDQFKYHDFLIWDSLEETFTKLKFGSYIPYWIDLTNSLDFLFSTSKPKAIFLIYETGPISLAFINSAKKFNIKTIGVQHGLITKYHKYYSHDEFATSENPYGFPLPHKFLLHGNITKKILLEKGFPAEKLETFGNPVFFNLNEIQKYLKNQLLFDKYELKKEKKIILLTTSHLQAGSFNTKKFDFDVQTWKVLLENFSNDPNFQLVLKPHPREKSEEYKKILEIFSPTDAKIIQGNLLELLYISSLTVVINSSTIFDSFAMKKPVIQVKFGNYISMSWDDFIPKVVYQTELKNLPDSIRKILTSKELQNELKANGIQFIKEYYNIPEITPDSHLKKIIED